MAELAQEQFEFAEQLGDGKFSKVFLVKEKSTKLHFAAKVLEKQKLRMLELERIESEIAILKEIDHPNIIKLHCSFVDDTSVVIITELCLGGELFDRIVQREAYNERDAQMVLRAIASAVNCLHQHNIIHRDLKPENILFSLKKDAVLKLCDFGFAKHIEEDDGAVTRIGTPSYIAPEIIQRKRYGKPVDVWAFGAIVYVLLCGYLPFAAENEAQLYASIQTASFEFDSPHWDNISQAAKRLISTCLQVDPTHRPTIEYILFKDEWMTNTKLQANDLTLVLQKLKATLKPGIVKLRTAFANIKSSSSLRRINKA